MQNIGFIGTGLMGFPMAKNILKAGYKVKAFNRSINKAEPLKDFGAEISNSIGELVKACLLYTSPSPRDGLLSRMPSSA